MTSVAYIRLIITDAVKVGTYTSHNLTVIIVTLLCFLNWPTTWSKAAVHMLWANKRLRPSTRPSWRKTWFHIFQRIRFLSVCCCPAFQGIFCLLLVLMSWALPPLWSVLSFLSSFFRNGSWLFRISSILIGLFILADSLLTSCLYLSTRKVRLATKWGRWDPLSGSGKPPTKRPELDRRRDDSYFKQHACDRSIWLAKGDIRSVPSGGQVYVKYISIYMGQVYIGFWKLPPTVCVSRRGSCQEVHYLQSD